MPTTQTPTHSLNMFQVAQMMAELNDQQREAAQIINGRVLVIAGAGSGKTKTLTTRMANMMSSGVQPWNIFCATFTNKAAKEMKERLAKAVGQDAADATWMGTFHSLCVRMLRKHAHLLGYQQKDGKSNFMIYDGNDVYGVIDRIFKIMNIEDKFKVGMAMNYIDNAKNNLWDPEYCLYNNAEGPANETMAIVYQRYQEVMKESNAMDFGDLIMNTVNLLSDFPEEAAYWQNKFQYVLADEYQDTNHAQFELLRLLAAPHYNIFVVGDVDQSIYKFRGSDINIILNFERHFAPCTVLKLEQNYRSSRNVVEVGNHLISHNPAAYDKVLRSDKADGEKIEVAQLSNEYAEAAYVATKIKNLVMSKDYNFKDFAILYRTSMQSMAFEQLFVHNFIPYQIIGGHGFLDREEIKDMTSYLRVIYNRKDDAAMNRILNKPTRGIGKTTQEAVLQYANEHKVSMYRALKAAKDIPGIKKNAQGKIQTFLDTLDHIEEQVEKRNTLKGFVSYLQDQSGLTKYYRERAEKEKDGHERIENLEEFQNVVSHYEENHPDDTLSEFLQEMSLVSDYQNEGKEQPNKVRLMTMHASKGLEFPVVFLVGMNEGLFPSWRSFSPEEVEEERRLAYVGVTRAEEELYLSTTELRSSPNGKGNQVQKPSRFLSELPQEIVNNVKINV